MDIQFKYQNNASKFSKPLKSLLNTSVNLNFLRNMMPSKNAFTSFPKTNTAVLTPAEHKTSAEKIKEINLCLQDMNTTQQKVFVLKTLKKQKTQDICEQLNITEHEFWKHINAARKELIEKLQIA